MAGKITSNIEFTVCTVTSCDAECTATRAAVDTTGNEKQF